MLGFRGAARYIDSTFRPCFELECRALRYVREEMGLRNVEVMWCEPDEWLELEGAFDGIWLGAAVPRVPERLRAHLVDPGGRLVAFVGPRFRRQDGLAVTRHGTELVERRFARVQVPVLGGPGG